MIQGAWRKGSWCRPGFPSGQSRAELARVRHAPFVGENRVSVMKHQGPLAGEIGTVGVMDRPKVLILSHTPQLGGAERVLVRFLAEQSAFQAVLAAPAGPLADAAAATGAEVRTCRHLGRLHRESNPAWALDFVCKLVGSDREILKAIERERPDILQANGFYSMPYLIFPAARARLPLLWHMHDFKPGLTGRWLCRFFAARSTGIVAVSHAVAEALRAHGVDPAKIKVIHNHVHPGHVSEGDSSLAGLLNDFKPVGGKLAGMMGNLEPRKGMALAVEAMGRLRGRPIRMAIAGPAEGKRQSAYRAHLIERIAALGIGDQVKLLGPIRGTGDFYSALDLFVHYPKDPDPLPTVLLEALAKGAPVLAADSGGNREILGQGRWGRLVRPREPGLLAEALMQPASQLRPQEREKFLAAFSLQVKSDSFGALYGEVLRHVR